MRSYTLPSHLGTTLDPAAWIGMTLPVGPPYLAIQINGAAEISRHFPPEPDDRIALTAGAAVLLCLVARRRRARRQALPSGRCVGRPLSA